MDSFLPPPQGVPDGLRDRTTTPQTLGVQSDLVLAPTRSHFVEKRRVIGLDRLPRRELGVKPDINEQRTDG